MAASNVSNLWPMKGQGQGDIDKVEGEGKGREGEGRGRRGQRIARRGRRVVGRVTRMGGRGRKVRITQYISQLTAQDPNVRR